MARESGILLPVTSLPGPYGVGALGDAAYRFVDFLRRAEQRVWQVLPLGPTGYGDSPYQCDSAFAGNPYLIDLERLIRDGLLSRAEAEAPFWGAEPERVDFGALYAGRGRLLALAAERGWPRDRAAVEAFLDENADWLPDYALYRALKSRFGMRPWTEWPDVALRLRSSREALERARTELAGEIRACVYTQFLFFRQWDALRAYARQQGVRLIGDVPIYVPLDSADVWAFPEGFQLDGQRRPTAVAGVPPDYFTADGQLWGNPLYDWERMRADGYGWWRRRMTMAARLFDVVRLDHFRALESYWAVPAGAPTAREGSWRQGPGTDFVDALRRGVSGLNVLAEDLGLITDAVARLRDYAGWPGMAVLQFAFGPDGGSSYLPHRLSENCVCYSGTHDNATLRQWLAEAQAGELAFLREYLGLGPDGDAMEAVLRAGLRSPAGLFLAPMQDWLGLGAEARLNRPGSAVGNWRWRMTDGAADEALASRIARMTRLYGR